MSINIEKLKEATADPGKLQAMLRESHTAPLLMVYVHLGGDPAWLDKLAPHIQGPWPFDEHAPDALKEELYQALTDLLLDYANSERPVPANPPKELLPKMLNTLTGQEVPPEYLEIAIEETDFAETSPKTVHWRKPVDKSHLADFKVILIGAGFSGVGMGLDLMKAGIPFVIYEKNDEVGGTWYENTYPGIAVDTANHFYSYSFDMNPNWDHYYAKGDAIQNYIVKNCNQNGLRNHIRFNTEVTEMIWNEKTSLWSVTTRDENGNESTTTANAVVSAVGQLNRPLVPEIKGLDTFKGPAFHSAEWDHSVDYNGKKVAVIGTGASGMQIAPTIAPDVEKCVIFQRSPHWAMPNKLVFETVSDNAKWVLEYVPYYNKWFRFQLFWATSDGFHKMLHVDPDWPRPQDSLNAQNQVFRESLEAYIRNEVKGDPELIKKATPNYPPYGKRMLRDGGWYKMLLRNNVDLVTCGIDHIEEKGIVDNEGKLHEVDIIALATGFKAKEFLAPMNIVGRGGVTIRDEWGDEDARAHLGITVPKFPNLFLIYGPNTNLAHGGSAVYHSECQVRYIMQALREMIESDCAAIEVKEESFWAYQEKVDNEHAGMVWAHKGVDNWYKNSKGRVTQNSPWRLVDYRNLTLKFNPAEYLFTRDEAETSSELELSNS